MKKCIVNASVTISLSCEAAVYRMKEQVDEMRRRHA